MAKRVRAVKCAFYYYKKYVGAFCLCDKDDPFKRCNGVCELYMSEQQYKEFMAQVLAEEKAKKERGGA